jgi:hypothetical protein
MKREGRTMLKDIVHVAPRRGYHLFLRFEDGVEGVVDVAHLVPFKGVFAPLKDEAEFRKVRVNRELGSIEWECGADLDPVVLYSVLTGKPLPNSVAMSTTESTT